MKQIAHIQNNKNEPTSFFSFFMEKLVKVDIIYMNRHLGSFLMKLSIPNSVVSPFIYSRNMSYHKNIIPLMLPEALLFNKMIVL